MIHCAFCMSKMIWQSDFNYDEIYAEREGVVSFYKKKKKKCGADAQFSLRDDE